MLGLAYATACDVLADPASNSSQRWQAYRVLLDLLEPHEHIWCRYTEAARFFCGLLEFPNSDLWKRLQQLLTSMSCRECVDVWSASVSKFLESLSNRFEEFSIDILISHMTDADLPRLKSLPADDAAFEILRRAHLCRNRDLNEIGCRFIEKHAHTSAGKSAVMLKNGRLAPVIYLFCLHPRSVIRSWCQSLVRASAGQSTSSNDILLSVVLEILVVLSKSRFEGSAGQSKDVFLYDLATFWNGLVFLLNVIPEGAHIVIATKMLSSKSCPFVERLLSFARLVTFSGTGSYNTLSEKVPEPTFSPTLSCLSWLMLNTSQIFWDNLTIIGPAVLADILRKGVLYATRSLEALIDAPYLCVKIIDIIPVFVMSLPEKERSNYIGSTIRFLVQIVSGFVSSAQKIVITLNIHIWSAIFKIVRCSFMMNSSPAVILCSDVWAVPITAFACSDFSSKTTEFLQFCSENVKATIVSDAIEAVRIALNQDVDNFKRIFVPDEYLVFALDDQNNRVLTSNGLWKCLSCHYKPSLIPNQLLEIVVSAWFQAVAIPPSFIALGFDQPPDVISAYNSVRLSSQTILHTLSSHPKLIRKLAGSRAEIPGLFLLLISYRDSSTYISELIRQEIQSSLKLSEKPTSVNECLSILYQQQPSQIAILYRQCLSFCSNATIFLSIEKLIKSSDDLPESAGSFLADLHPSIFWIDRLFHLISTRSQVESSLDSFDTDSIWKLFFLLVVSCIEFHLLPEFDRTFSALFDMSITLLSLKPAFLTSFRQFFKSWLLKRELIPSGTRRRWFQFVRAYIRIFPDEKEVARSVLTKYHGDSLWLYRKGLSDQAQRNYLSNLIPSICGVAQDELPLSQTTNRLGSSNGPSSGLLKDLPSLHADHRRRDIGPSVMHSITVSKPPSRTISTSVFNSKSFDRPVRASSDPYRSPHSFLHKSAIDNEANLEPRNDSATVSGKSNRLRAVFQSLRDDPELSKHAHVIKSVSAKPLTSLKASSALKRRSTNKLTNSSLADGSIPKIEKLPVKSLCHFLNIILDWSLQLVTGDTLPKELSEMMMDPLPKSFDSFTEYRKAYGPLILEETRAMIQNDYEGNRDLRPMTVVKQGIDTTPHPSLPGSLLLCSPRDLPDHYRISESDLLLIWPIMDDADFETVPSNAVFGIVDGQSNATRLLIRVTRCPTTDARFKHQLGFVRISSLVTSLRMARALESVARLRLGPALILGQQETSALGESFDTENSVLSGLNTSQKTAIMHCICSKDPVILLQGPPGTGKSTVIVALIKALLERSTNRHISQLGQGWKKSTDFDSRHILLCTPSNAAADELTSRLVSSKIQAVPDSTQYPVIRYGSNVTSDINAESVSLDRLASVAHSAQNRSGSQLEPNPVVSTGHDRRSVQELREKLLSEANILVCTLSGSGAPSIGNIPHSFQVVIVDEAAQAHEIETLIPLQYSCRKLILVGDPRQLPATVLSTYAGKFGLNRSMFERLESVVQPVMLTEQYRMHPDICLFPSNQFYHGRVITAGINRSVPIHGNPFIRPYVFFDIDSEDRMVNFSRKNMKEAEFVVQLLSHIERTAALYGMIRPSIGIVTPYQAQVQEIRHQGLTILKAQPDVRTIDSFQGQERDIIIISAVRASAENDPSKSLGFVADGRRLNVALTRAKLCCLIVGSARTLADSASVWKNLIANAKERNCFISVPRKSFQEFLQQSNGAARKRVSPSSLDTPLQPGIIPKKRRPIDRTYPRPTGQITTHPSDPKPAQAGSVDDPTSLDSNRKDLNVRAAGFQGVKSDSGSFSPNRRRKLQQGKRFQSVGPDPAAIKRQVALQSGSSSGQRISPIGKPAQMGVQSKPHDNAASILQKSTASLALDDILGAM